MASNEILMETIIHKGAEANLIYGHWFGKEVIFKHRVPKGYRIDQIDKKLRVNRTLNEGKALIRVKNYGVNVPQVYEIEANNSMIVMKFIKGEKLRDALKSITNEQKVKFLNEIGKFIAILHKNGHIHGDITTSNVIITETKEIFIIDFDEKIQKAVAENGLVIRVGKKTTIQSADVLGNPAQMTEKVDLVILCGDITSFDTSTSNLIGPFVKRHKKVLLIPGNHESFATADFLAQVYGIKNIHGYSVRYGDVGVFGAGGANIGIEQLEERELLGLLKKGFDKIKYLKKISEKCQSLSLSMNLRDDTYI